MLRREANTIQNNSKILIKEVNNIIKESDTIKDNKIVHRKKINDSTQAKNINDVSSKIVIHEQFLYPKFKNKPLDELK